MTNRFYASTSDPRFQSQRQPRYRPNDPNFLGDASSRVDSNMQGRRLMADDVLSELSASRVVRFETDHDVLLAQDPRTRYGVRVLVAHRDGEVILNQQVGREEARAKIRRRLDDGVEPEYGQYGELWPASQRNVNLRMSGAGL